MEVLTVAKPDSARSILHVKKRQTALAIIVLASLCGIASASGDPEWTGIARRIIIKWDHIERQMKAFCEQKPPANVSQKYARAWQVMMWKAKKVRWICPDIIKWAQYVEQGDLSKRTIEKLLALIHDFDLAWNEFEESFEALKRVQQEES